MLELEISILDRIPRNAVFDAIFLFFSKLGDAGFLWIALTLILLLRQKTRRLGICMAIALLLNLALCNGIIKPLLRRQRPFTYREIPLLLKAPTDGSFPSGHASSSFAAASTLVYNKSRLWLLAIPLAGLIAFSRLYLYVHFPTDVLTGVFLGFFCGLVACTGEKAVWK